MQSPLQPAPRHATDNRGSLLPTVHGSLFTRSSTVRLRTPGRSSEHQPEARRQRQAAVPARTQLRAPRCLSAAFFAAFPLPFSLPVRCLSPAIRCLFSFCQESGPKTKVMIVENKPLPRQNTSTNLAWLDAVVGILKIERIFEELARLARRPAGLFFCISFRVCMQRNTHERLSENRG